MGNLDRHLFARRKAAARNDATEVRRSYFLAPVARIVDSAAMAADINPNDVLNGDLDELLRRSIARPHAHSTCLDGS